MNRVTVHGRGNVCKEISKSSQCIQCNAYHCLYIRAQAYMYTCFKIHYAQLQRNIIRGTLEFALGKSFSNHCCPMNCAMYSGRGVGGGGGVGGGVGLFGGGGGVGDLGLQKG